jgi:hypothetical protein
LKVTIVAVFPTAFVSTAEIFLSTLEMSSGVATGLVDNFWSVISIVLMLDLKSVIMEALAALLVALAVLIASLIWEALLD